MSDMKVYTRAGDKGMTSLVSGTKISKGHERLRAYGELDELNSLIGFTLVVGMDLPENHLSLLQVIQEELFVAGSHLATESEKRESLKLPKLNDQLVTKIEEAIDSLDQDLPPLKNFLLPGGCELAARFNLCRVTCRRVESSMVELSESMSGEVPAELMVLLNRLSDYFFIAGRWANVKSNTEETLWMGRKA